jgi:anti-sigma B factor antagonist
MPASCTVRVEHPGPAIVLTLIGEVDGGATDVLLPAYDAAAAGDPAPAVVLDLAGVDYVNSTGIALIVSVLTRARAQGRTVLATGLSEHYRQIFEITRLSDYITLHPDLGDALRSLPEGT